MTPLSIVIAGVVSSSGAVSLDYAPDALPVPQRTEVDDLCRVVTIPNVECFEEGTCSHLENELFITSVCYRRNWRNTKDDLKVCQASLELEKTMHPPSLISLEESERGFTLGETLGLGALGVGVGIATGVILTLAIAK